MSGRGPRTLTRGGRTSSASTSNALTRDNLIRSGTVAIKTAVEAKKYLEVLGFSLDEGGTGDPPTLECIANLMFMASQDKTTKLMNHLCAFALILEELTEQQIVSRIVGRVMEQLDPILAEITVSLWDQMDYLKDQTEQLETTSKTYVDTLDHLPHVHRGDEDDINPDMMIPLTIAMQEPAQMNTTTITPYINSYANAARTPVTKSANHQAAIERSVQRLMKIIIDVEGDCWNTDSRSLRYDYNITCSLNILFTDIWSIFGSVLVYLTLSLLLCISCTYLMTFGLIQVIPCYLGIPV
jgi:hypothetical protein